ncbi:hypothetical protein A2U01_0060655, partial [Trifolium medium]|nr:hypothetical protein [Trifolium medium]
TEHSATVMFVILLHLVSTGPLGIIAMLRVLVTGRIKGK